MTNEEAIFTIEHRYGIMDYGETEQLAEALDMAIDALKAQPCDDAVSREAVLTIFDEWFSTCDIADKRQSPKAKINALPSVTPKQKTGKWIDAGHYFERSWATCSECKENASQHTDNDGWGFSIRFLKYCPNCGAKMEKEGE